MSRKVKVAILDTGIDRIHTYLKDSIHSGVSFLYQDKQVVRTENNFEDEHGHGTACASVIKKECNGVALVPIKILDHETKTNLAILEEALLYLLETDIRLINLSLSVINSDMVSDLQKLCNLLTQKNKIIVCSLANGFEISCPAVFDKVIGVKGHILEDEHSFWYNRNKNIQCIMDNNSYLCCGINNSYQMFGKCNSYAAAKLTGIVAGILEEEPLISLDDLNLRLEHISRKNEWTSDDLTRSKRFPDFKNILYKENSDILKSVINIVKEYIGRNVRDEVLYQHTLINPNVGLTYDDCFNLIKKIEETFCISFDYMSISRYDFVSIYTLTYLVENSIKGIIK